MSGGSSVLPILKGLVFQGFVTVGGSTTAFTAPFTGNSYPNFANQFWVICAGKVDGSANPPYNTQQLCTSYNRATGQFITNPFSAPLSTGDYIYLVHNDVAAILQALASTNDVSAFTSVGGFQNNQYEEWQDYLDISASGLVNYKAPALRHSNDTEVNTSSLVPATAKSATLTRDIIGGCQVSFDYKSGVAGTLTTFNLRYNGVALSPPTTDNTGAYRTATYTIPGLLSSGKVVDLLYFTANAAVLAYVKNFRISYAIESDVVRRIKAVEPQTKILDLTQSPTLMLSGGIWAVHYFQGYLYVGTTETPNPARIFKIDPTDMRVVGVWTGTASQLSITAITDDGTNIYACLATVPAQVVQVRVSDMTTQLIWTGAAGQNLSTSLVYYALDRCLYLGLDTSPGQVVKIYTATMTTFSTWVGAAGENTVTSVVVDYVNDYIVAGIANNPAKFKRITRVTMVTFDEWTAPAGYANVSALAFDGGNYYVGVSIGFGFASSVLKVAVSAPPVTISSWVDNGIAGGIRVSGLKWDGVNLLVIVPDGVVPTVVNLNPMTMVARSFWAGNYAYGGTRACVESDGQFIFAAAVRTITKVAIPGGDYLEFTSITSGMTVPLPNSAANVFERDVVGNKSDAAVIVVGVVASITGYIKGCLNQLASIIASLAAFATLTETGGTLLADGTEQNVVINNAPAAVFKALHITLDLENMDANDTIVIKWYERISAGGALNLSDQPITYTGVVGGLPNSQKQITIDLKPNRYGFKVTLQQTAHVSYKNYVWEYIYEA